eukprot:6212338-Pleurochrysis_carterae.AAC.2
MRWAQFRATMCHSSTYDVRYVKFQVMRDEQKFVSRAHIRSFFENVVEETKLCFGGVSVLNQKSFTDLMHLFSTCIDVFPGRELPVPIVRAHGDRITATNDAKRKLYDDSTESTSLGIKDDDCVSF